MQGTNFQIDAEPLLKVPIYYPNNLKKYLDLFDKLKKNYKNEKQVSTMERELNKFLYLDLNFSEQEINLIEENTFK